MNNFLFITLFSLLFNIGLPTFNVNCIENDLNLLVMAKYLDSSTLSRLAAFKNYLSDERPQIRPKFLNGWVYQSKLVTGWTRRLGMYGYGITALNSRGDGNCMFYTIHTIFTVNNIKNKDLVEYLNPDLEPAVSIAIRGMLDSDGLIDPLDFKRISNIIWLGVDPYDEDSVKLFKPEPLLHRLEEMIPTHLVFQDDEGNLTEGGALIALGVNVSDFYERIKAAQDKIPIVRELMEAMERKFLDRHGDFMDIFNLEFAFQMKLINLNKKDTTLSCGMNDYNFNPKFILTILYEDGCHYDVAGIYKLGKTDKKDIKSMFKITEIPYPLLMFISQDC